MNPVFKKLNFKEHKSIVVINAPQSFQVHTKEMALVTDVITDRKKARAIEFVISFVTKQKEIDEILAYIGPKLQGDAVVWFCYPKGTSKKYTCDFNRDSGWASLADYDLEPVRMVAIDEDWSALRTRKVEYIKKITRRESFAITKQAKARTSQKGK